MKRSSYIIIAVIIILIGTGLYYESRQPEPIVSGDLPDINVGRAPWPAEQDKLRDRLRAIGLPALVKEGNILHTHQHLDIYINGKPEIVPEHIGLNEEKKFVSPIHTHDETGIIHVESPTIREFTLGQFFDVWGVRFSNDCIGGYCSDTENNLKVFVDGIRQEDFRKIKLKEDDEIVITYGKDSELPSPIPSSYDFSALK